MFSIEPGQLVSDEPTFTPIKFMDKEELKDRKYSLYLFAQIDDYKELHLKFGEAKKQSIFERYNSTSCVHNDHMIRIWSSDKGDKEIHEELMSFAGNKRGYIWDGRKEDNGTTHTSESYSIPNEEAFYNFMKDLEDVIQTKPLERVDEEVYGDISLFIKEFCKRKEKNLN